METEVFEQKDRGKKIAASVGQKEGFCLEMEASSENEAFARAVTAAYLARANPTVEQLEDVKTAVSEAVTNAIVHGYAVKQGKVILRGWLENRVFYVSIQDRGTGIEDIALAMEPFYTTVLDGTRSGMGFCMMEAFMDDVEIISVPGEGTVVQMKKDLDALEGEEEE